MKGGGKGGMPKEGNEGRKEGGKEGDGGEKWVRQADRDGELQQPDEED